MRMYKLFERNDEDTIRFKKALRTAKSAIHEACELAEDMEDKFSGMEERGGYYGERRGVHPMMPDMYERGMMDGYNERRYRDSMGRFM